MDNILFEITGDQLDTGMRGYPVGYCVTSSVDPQKGLHYCGIPVAEIASRPPQSVIYLLYHGKEGSEREVAQFFEELKGRAILSKEVQKGIISLPRESHPMKLLSMSLLLLDVFEGKSNYEEDCLNVIAKLPHLVATVINHHCGWGLTKTPNLSIGYMAAFTEMVNIPHKESHLEEAFRFFNVLHYDHGGGNLSAFIGKAVASGLESLMGSLSAAMCALAGPRHGSANEKTLEFVKSIHVELGDQVSAEAVESLIRNRLENNQLVFGFGHAVLRVEDPRATVMYEFIEKYYSDHPLVQTTLLLRKVGPKVLSENPKITSSFPNVDAASGVMLTAAGFGYPEYYTVLFGLSRCVGIAIQIVFERCLARGGKGTPIVRPKYLYKNRLS